MFVGAARPAVVLAGVWLAFSAVGFATIAGAYALAGDLTRRQARAIAVDALAGGPFFVVEILDSVVRYWRIRRTDFDRRSRGW